MNWQIFRCAAALLGTFMLPLLPSCRTTQTGTLSGLDMEDCATASFLDRTLALLHPESLAPPRATCLVKCFQADLQAERSATHDVRTKDSYDAIQTAAASSKIGDLIYTRNNLIDQKVYLGGPEIQLHR